MNKYFLSPFLKHLWTHPGHLLWVVLAYLPPLGTMNILMIGNQKLYFNIAMEMRERASLLTPYLFGEPNYLRPPFQLWMMLFSWKVFGFNLWATLLPSVIFLLITAWLLGEISGFLHERRWFINSGLWFAIALGTVLFGTIYQTEIYVCFFYTASWWAMLKYLYKPIDFRDRKWLYIAFILAGISALVKNPIYPLIWSMGVLSYLILSGEWELFREKCLHRSFLIGILVGIFWYVFVFFHDRQRAWTHFLQQLSLETLNNTDSVFGLWLSFLYLCFPFTLMIFVAIRTLIKKGRRVSNLVLFAISWVWPIVLVFSFFNYRNHSYAYLLVPLFALLADWAYFRVGRTKIFRAVVVISGVCVCLFSSGLALLVYRGDFASPWIALGFVVCGIWILVCSFKDWMRGMILCCLVSVFLFRATISVMGEWDLSVLKNTAINKPSASIGFLDEENDLWSDVGLLSVTIRKPILRLTNLDQITEHLQKGGIVALDEEQAKNNIRTIEAKLLGKGDFRILEEKIWPRWQRKSKFPLKKFLQEGKTGVSDFVELTQQQYKILWLKDL
ncbi:MAG: glycosyltransferase family 39 protein [Bdellovibrio sp.]|nr:glycosyltransferase family 39 protein [Bdellovibrio sp.]